MKALARLVAGLALAAGLAPAAAFAGAAPSFPGLPQARIQVTTATGTHEFQVWIAADDESRERGLMHVRELPPDRGMLFMFEAPGRLGFWMKDTYLSLDLVFIGPDGRVLNIAANARPLSLDPILSRGEAIAVLEVVAGTARRIGLEPGDVIPLSTLRTTGAPAPSPVGS
jgi:uncharacterized protein